jgi:hypothetical protein
MRKNLPPSARVEAVRRLGWRLGPGIETSGTTTEEASPRPTQASEGGDQIRRFLEDWQQKYRESEERYRAERDEAFRSDDEVTRAQEQLVAERAAELKKRTETIEQRLPLITARLGVLWNEVTGSSRPVPSEIRLTSTGTEMTAEEHVATAETHLRYAEGHLQPTEEHIADAEVHLKLVKAHLAALAAAEPPEVELCGTGTRPPVELAGGKADTGRRSAAPEGGRDPTPRPGTERGSGSDDGRPRPEAGEHLACPMRECRGLAIHPLDGCENFRSLSVTQREKVIKDWNRCECCLTDCRDKRTGSRCYRRIGFRRHHLLRLVPQAEASSAGDKKRQQQRPRRRVAKGDQTIPQGKPNQGDVRHDRGSAKALQPDVIIGWPDWSKVQPFVANGWAVSGQTPPGATAPATKWHLRMNQKGGPPMYLNVELDSMRQRSTITQEAAARMGRQYGASYMLSARAEDGEVRSLVAGGAITIIRADRRRPVERASKGPDLLLNAKDTNGMAKCLKPGWKSEEEIGGHGGCPVEGQWHGKLRGRQVLRDPGWTCVLFVKTGGASQDIFIRVMDRKSVV